MATTTIEDEKAQSAPAASPEEEKAQSAPAASPQAPATDLATPDTEEKKDAEAKP
jgi:hypothetical protein